MEEDLKTKAEIIENIESICKINKNNKYCTIYQLKEIINKEFELEDK